MNETLDLEGMWPELFEGMDHEGRRAVIDACAANWHEGWQPNYEDVKNLCDLDKGLIDDTEYWVRAQARVDSLYPAKVAA